MADWIINRPKATITCSKCKAKLNAKLFMDMLEKWNYCPYCGADMRAEQTKPKCEECQHYGHKVKRCLLNKCKYTADTDCGWK